MADEQPATGPDRARTDPAAYRASPLASDAPIKGPSWSRADRAAVTLRTEHEPLGFTPEMAELVRVGRALGDAMRVRILALLAEEDAALYGQELAARLNTTPQTISHHLAILREAGLIREERRQTYRYYSLDGERIEALRGRLFGDNRLGLPTKAEMRARVLATFFHNGELASIPTQPGKRRYVLEELARGFIWGRVYDEREVNAILGHFHEDTAQLRRLLVDEGLLARDAGRYWKPRPELGDSHAEGAE